MIKVPAVWVRLRRNIAVIIAGNLTASAIGFLTLAFNSRALGVEGLGVLAFVTAFGALIQRLFDFDVWQAIVTKGSAALVEGQKDRFSQLVVAGLALDICAAIASATIAVTSSAFFGDLIGIPAETNTMASIYLASLLFTIIGTPTGIFRSLDRFNLAMYYSVIEAAGKMACAAILFVVSAPLSWYLLLYAGVSVTVNIARLVHALRLLPAEWPFSLHTARRAWNTVGPEMWRFAWKTNVSGALMAVRVNGPKVILGTVAGPTAVGIYMIAERLAIAVPQFFGPVVQAVLPEMSAVARDTPAMVRQLAKTMEWIALVVGSGAIAAVLLFGHFIIDVLAGDGFEEAFAPLLLLTVAQSITVLGTGMRPALLVLRGPGVMLSAEFAAVSLLLIFGPVAAIYNGAIGMSAAQIGVAAGPLFLLFIAFSCPRGDAE